MRKPFVGGNWKCTGSTSNVAALVAGLNAQRVPSNVDVSVAPSHLYLSSVKSTLKADYLVSAQNCSATGEGAFTGEVSCEQLVDSGVKWVILGHSERRAYYQESDAVVGDKVAKALQTGMYVIACVGETLDERKANRVMNVLKRQLRDIADNVSDWGKVVLAYEPVWAIGTGVTASPEQAQEVHAGIRSFLAAQYGKDVAQQVRIIYGGSVKPNNSAELMAKKDIDGFLVGGASLKASDFGAIVASAGAQISSKL